MRGFWIEEELVRCGNCRSTLEMQEKNWKMQEVVRCDFCGRGEDEEVRAGGVLMVFGWLGT